jgi:hypothetical protein
LAGFSNTHPPIKEFLSNLSKKGNIEWNINNKSITIKKNTIYFKSRTLDKIANLLADNMFKRIKGKKFSGIDWHISFPNCAIPSNMINILDNLSWSFVIVRENKNGTYTWLEKYIITM